MSSTVTRSRHVACFAAAMVLAPAVVLPGATDATAVEATETQADFTPGAPGAGDPYFPRYGNGGYDVEHYDLHIRWGQRKNRIKGRTVIRATATQDLSRFNLDLVGLNVHRIKVDGRRAAWSRSEHELKITPDFGLPNGSRFKVAIRYSGRPTKFRFFDAKSGWLRTTDGGAVTIGKPEVAAGWFPVNDHPRDKASYSISVTAANQFDVVSNGWLIGKKKGAKRTTWHWNAAAPMASYLAMVGIGRYDVEKYRTEEGWRVHDAVQTSLTRHGKWAKQALAKQVKVVRFLEKRFGEYPFAALGGTVVNTSAYFDLESQTRPVYVPQFFNGERGDRSVLVHELAHQWFGNDVSVDRWRDTWLSEGFATYASWIWNQAAGLQTRQALFDRFADIPAKSDFWKVVVADPGPRNIYSDPISYRGAMTLHVLREKVGKSNFFEILRQWAATKAGGNGSTAEFEALAERVSGEDLDRLFKVWLHTPEKPRGIEPPGRGA